MIVKGRAGARVQECEAEFEVANFLETCFITDTVSNSKKDCREIMSGPILEAEQYRFGLAVVWSVKSDGTVDVDKNLGMYVKRLDAAAGKCFVSYEMQVLNSTPSRNMVLSESAFPMFSDIGRGWSQSFDRSDGGRHEGIEGLPLSNIFDAKLGWLHSGALRVIAKLSVVLGVEHQGPIPSAQKATGQQEVCDCLERLLTAGNGTDPCTSADVTLKVGDEQLKAHSLILSARSPVF